MAVNNNSLSLATLKQLQRPHPHCSRCPPAVQVQSATRPVARAVAAAVTLGTGASLGPEGPSVDIGRSVARALGARLKSQVGEDK